MSGAVVVANAKLLVANYDLGGDVRAITLNLSSAMLDNTTFPAAGSATATKAISRLAGLKDASLNANGFINLTSSASDAVIFGNLGAAVNPLVTLFPNGITVGSTAAGSGYALQGGVSKYAPFGAQVGALLPFAVDVVGATVVAKAIALHDFTGTALSTGVTNGTAFQFGAVSTCQALYAGLHVTALSTTLGTTITGVIQAATSSGFASPSTRITFTAQSCKAASWATPVAASALSTDQLFWRAQFTVSTGTSTGGSANGLIWMSQQQ